MDKYDRASHILLIAFIVLTLVSVLATYYQSLVLRDYEIINDVEDVAS